jgi:hypothetical protein
MPWEITIRRPDGSPLGDFDSVRHQLTQAVPGIAFYQEPSGAEKVTTYRQAGIELPEIGRQGLEKHLARVRAECASGKFSISFYGLESEPLCSVLAEVRGNGNPVPVLAALCVPNGWIAIDDASGTPVDLSGGSPTGWDDFREYRSRAIRDPGQTSDDARQG